MKQSVTSWRLITTTEHPPAPRLTEPRGADVGTPSRHSLPPNERHRVQGQDRRRSPPRGVGGTRTCDKRTPRGAARTSGEEVDGAEQGTEGNEYRARRGHRSRPAMSHPVSPVTLRTNVRRVTLVAASRVRAATRSEEARERQRIVGQPDGAGLHREGLTGMASPGCEPVHRERTAERVAGGIPDHEPPTAAQAPRGRSIDLVSPREAHAPEAHPGQPSEAGRGQMHEPDRQPRDLRVTLVRRHRQRSRASPG